MKKVCIITGSRAEWGLLSRLAGLIDAADDMQLQIVATNMHLSERYGLTYREIEADGFTIDYRVPMESLGDTAGDTVRSMGVEMSGFAEVYDALRPDLLVVLGDRYEILVAVSAAVIYKIPVAHIHGGEITEGAYDDAMRHAITKMSHLHFTSTEVYRRRVIQMGEQPDRVFNVGAMGVDNIKNVELLSKVELERSMGGFMVDENTILVTFHPVTMENGTAGEQMTQLLASFDTIRQLRVIFTMPNSDTDGVVLIETIKKWCEKNPQRAVSFVSLGLKRYLSALKYVKAVVGNSSSGIIEAPSFGIATLDIGDRQKGRVRADSVVHCEPIMENITVALNDILAQCNVGCENPYQSVDSRGAAVQIMDVLTEVDFNRLVEKHFYDITNE